MLTVAAPPPLQGPHAAAPRPAAVGHDLQRAVEQFLYRQADHLDSKRWQDFIDLFAPDGVYWAPAHPHQTSGDGVPSIFYEDRDLMLIRLRRLHHPRAWSQKTEWATSHVVSNVIVEAHDTAAGTLTCRSRFHLIEFRRDQVRHFGGAYTHRLVRAGGDWRIRLQRVDLVNGEGPFEYVLQAWV
jgi:benzoate/toluate 1,2-dioxygenase beta subunit